MDLLQQLLNGLLIGGLYALFAMGLSLTMGVLQIFNVAHAGTFTLSAIAGVMAADHWGFSFPAVLLTGVAVGFVIGVILEFAAFRPLRRREYSQPEARESATLIASLAALFVMESIAQIVTDTRYLNFPDGLFDIHLVRWGGFSFRSIAFIMFLVAIALTAVVWWVVRRTQAGRSLRAVAADVDTAEMLGINANRHTVATLGFAGAMAGLAAILIGIAFNSVHFLMGETYLLKGMVIMVLGGLGSIPGTLVGGLALGLTEGLAVHYLSTSWRDAVAFGLLLMVLAARPNGLFGQAEVNKS